MFVYSTWQGSHFPISMPSLNKNGIENHHPRSSSHHSSNFLYLRISEPYEFIDSLLNEMHIYMNFSSSFNKFAKTPDSSKHIHLFQKNLAWMLSTFPKQRQPRSCIWGLAQSNNIWSFLRPLEKSWALSSGCLYLRLRIGCSTTEGHRCLEGKVGREKV